MLRGMIIVRLPGMFMLNLNFQLREMGKWKQIDIKKKLVCLSSCNFSIQHSVHWGINPALSCQCPLNWQTV